MVTESQPKPIARAAAEILLENGAHIVQCFETGESQFRWFPRIYFRGDEDEGHRAIKILLKHGTPVSILRREWWNGDGENYEQIIWAIELFPNLQS